MGLNIIFVLNISLLKVVLNGWILKNEMFLYF